jgi:hypothetical protein
MLVASTPSQAKSGAQTELPEDHCLDLEDPEDYQQEDEEPAANL